MSIVVPFSFSGLKANNLFFGNAKFKNIIITIAEVNFEN
jgi:hypothetical protein